MDKIETGDVVKYITHNAMLGRWGFGINSAFSVREFKDGSLYVQNSHGCQVRLVNANGTVTAWRQSFAKVLRGASR